MGKITVCLLAACLACGAWGKPPITAGGNTYTNYTIIRISGDTAILKHPGGVVSVPLSVVPRGELPEEVPHVCAGCNGAKVIRVLCPNCRCIKCSGGIVRCAGCNGEGMVQCPECKGRKFSADPVVEISCPACGGDGKVWRRGRFADGSGFIRRPPATEEDYVTVACPSCKGTGKIENPEPAYCSECNGVGLVPCRSCGGKKGTACTVCGGRGRMAVPCEACGNRGFIEKKCPYCGGK